MAVSDIKELIKRLLSIGFTQVPAYRKLFFPENSKRRSWVNDSEDASTGHRTISLLSKLTNGSEQSEDTGDGHETHIYSRGIKPIQQCNVNFDQLLHNELVLDILLKFE